MMEPSTENSENYPRTTVSYRICSSTTEQGFILLVSPPFECMSWTDLLFESMHLKNLSVDVSSCNCNLNLFGLL
jgi:hypothetical protein